MVTRKEAELAIRKIFISDVFKSFSKEALNSLIGFTVEHSKYCYDHISPEVEKVLKRIFEIAVNLKKKPGRLTPEELKIVIDSDLSIKEIYNQTSIEKDLQDLELETIAKSPEPILKIEIERAYSLISKFSTKRKFPIEEMLEEIEKNMKIEENALKFIDLVLNSANDILLTVKNLKTATIEDLVFAITESKFLAKHAICAAKSSRDNNQNGLIFKERNYEISEELSRNINGILDYISTELLVISSQIAKKWSSNIITLRYLIDSINEDHEIPEMITKVLKL